jgi:hypothetical protein
VTSDEIQAELDHLPFIPFRLHLVSGTTLNVRGSSEGWMFESSILVTHRRKNRESSYNVASLKSIERIERLNED